jgi:hypothetical protein
MYLIEPHSRQVFGNQVLQFIRTVVFALYRETRLESRRYLYIVVSVYAEDVFYNITRTLHIDTVRRYSERQVLRAFSDLIFISRLVTILLMVSTGMTLPIRE